MFSALMTTETVHILWQLVHIRRCIHGAGQDWVYRVCFNSLYAGVPGMFRDDLCIWPVSAVNRVVIFLESWLARAQELQVRSLYHF